MQKIQAIQRPTNQQLIGFLEELVTRAKSGSVTGVVIIEQDVKGVSYTQCGISDRFKTIGYLSHAIYQLQDDE